MINYIYKLGFIGIFSIVLTSTVFAQVKNNQDTTKTVKKDKKIKIAPIPYLNYDRTFGFMGGAFFMGFYKINPNDTISPTSSTGIGGIYSENNTWFTFISQKLYLAEDKWRINASLGLGKIYFQTYYEVAPGYGDFIDYTNAMWVVKVAVERKIYNHLYGGMQYSFYQSETAYDKEELKTNDTLVNYSPLGFVFEFDNRDDNHYPRKGFLIKYDNYFYNDNFGSAYDFTKHRLSINYFADINSNLVLLSRFHTYFSLGDVPFTEQRAVGQGDIRGYSQGKYRANQIFDIQSEGRLRFNDKWGMVFFGALAIATDDLSKNQFNDILPGVGLGVRYMAIPSEKMNIGFEVALGKDDWGIYFRIGETFGR